MTQHGMTSLRETDFVQDYCLSQRPLNGKTMHNKEVKYTAEPNDSCYDMGIPDRPGGRPSTCTESYCGQHTFPLPNPGQRDRHAHARRCTGSSGLRIKTEDSVFVGLRAQAGRFSCVRRQKY